MDKETMLRELRDQLKTYQSALKMRTAAHIRVGGQMANEGFRELIEKIEKELK